jgi:hypothetical protein
MNLKEIDNEQLVDDLIDGHILGNPLFNSTDKLKAELLSRLEQGEKATKRYNLVRILKPKAFKDIYDLNLSTGKPFDEIIDGLMPFYQKG